MAKRPSEADKAKLLAMAGGGDFAPSATSKSGKAPSAEDKAKLLAMATASEGGSPQVRKASGGGPSAADKEKLMRMAMNQQTRVTGGVAPTAEQRAALARNAMEGGDDDDDDGDGHNGSDDD